MESKPQTRRVFLAHSAALSLGLLGVGLLGLSACRPANPNPRPPQPAPPTPDKPTPNSSGKKLLEQADFRFVGAFRLPSSVQGEQSEDAAWGRTLALRRVAGEVRLLSLTVKGNLFEVRLPKTLSSSGPFPVAQTVRYWGDPCGDQKLLDPGHKGETRDGSSVYGLFWDEKDGQPDGRLYWSYGDGYNTVSSTDPSLGYSTLEEATGKVSSLGAWRFSGVGCKANMGGVLEIPAWFADKYCAGQRLGAGFGGYFSIATVGPVSMGPSLTAFLPPTPHPKGTAGSLEHTPLLGYPFNATPYTAPTRAERDADYHTEFDGWNPRANVGYWSWSDWLWQGAVWVDTPTRHGLLYFPTLGNGRTWYETSTLHAEHSSHAWYVYDPTDLAKVAQERLERWQIQAAGRWKVSYPGQSDPLPGWADEPQQMVVGSVWDAASSRVYLALRQTFNPDSSGERGLVVYAYEVQG